MPELPEVETTRRGLIPHVQGRTITDVIVRERRFRQLIPEDFSNKINGQQVLDIKRRSKYLLIELKDSQIILVHLGMSGRMIISPVDEPLNRHDHVIFKFEHSPIEIRFRDPRRFGLVLLTDNETYHLHPLLKSIGIEALSDEVTPEYFLKIFKNKKAPVKNVLLDQRLVAGLGNIYVCEILYRSHISPLRSSNTITYEEAILLVPAIQAVLTEAIAAGGSTLKDHRQPSGELGYFQHSFAVYDRAGLPCPLCGNKYLIQRITQAGRSSFFCPNHQL